MEHRRKTAQSVDHRRSIASAALLTAALIDERAIGRNEQRNERLEFTPLVTLDKTGSLELLSPL